MKTTVCHWADAYDFKLCDAYTKMFICASNWMDRAEHAESRVAMLVDASDNHIARIAELERALREIADIRNMTLVDERHLAGCCITIARAALEGKS